MMLKETNIGDDFSSRLNNVTVIHPISNRVKLKKIFSR